MNTDSSCKPVFIVGTPRSGTTLTAKILGRHSELFMPGETHYFDDIVSRSDESRGFDNDETLANICNRLYTLYERYYEYEDQKRIEKMYDDSQSLIVAMRGCKTYRDIFDRFMMLQMVFENKKRWGNNAPRDLFCIDEIMEYFPDAKIVVCVRDVRAFLLSYKGKWKVTGDDHVERLKKLYHPVVTSLLWKASMKILPSLKRRFSSDDLVIVKYEELVNSPEETVRKVCNVIEVDFEPEMLKVETHNSSNTVSEKGIFSTSVDKWKSELSPEEIFVSQLLCRSQLAFLEYPQYKVSISFLAVFIVFVNAPFALWRALDANKEMRGPLLPYLFKRLSALLRS